MALDRTKLHKGFTSYLNNAEQASGKKYEDFALALSKSGLKSHGDLARAPDGQVRRRPWARERCRSHLARVRWRGRADRLGAGEDDREGCTGEEGGQGASEEGCEESCCEEEVSAG